MMIVQNNILVRNYNNGVATLYFTLGPFGEPLLEDIAKSCKKMYFGVLAKDFRQKLKDNFYTDDELKTICFEANDVIVKIPVEELPAKSSNYIYFMWLREYFKLQASHLQLPDFELTAEEIIDFSLDLKDKPDEEYIIKYNPYSLFVVTLIAKLYQHLLHEGMEDVDATQKARELYSFFKNKVNYCFEIIMEEIRLYI